MRSLMRSVADVDGAGRWSDDVCARWFGCRVDVDVLRGSGQWCMIISEGCDCGKGEGLLMVGGRLWTVVVMIVRCGDDQQ